MTADIIKQIQIRTIKNVTVVTKEYFVILLIYILTDLISKS